MTRDEIMQMEAGREMDALVAERVIGLDVVRGKALHQSLDGILFYKTVVVLVRYPAPGIERHDVEACTKEVPEYSTDVSAAWEVVDKLRLPPNFWSFSIYGDTKIIFCNFRKWVSHNNWREVEAVAETAPLAICRAALLAELLRGEE